MSLINFSLFFILILKNHNWSNEIKIIICDINYCLSHSIFPIFLQNIVPFIYIKCTSFLPSKWSKHLVLQLWGIRYFHCWNIMINHGKSHEIVELAGTFLFVSWDNTSHYSPKYPLLLTSDRKSPRCVPVESLDMFFFSMPLHKSVRWRCTESAVVGFWSFLRAESWQRLCRCKLWIITFYWYHLGTSRWWNQSIQNRTSSQNKSYTRE